MRIDSLKRWGLCAGIALLGGALLVDPAFAQGAAEVVAEASSGQGPDDHHSGGLPQLNPASYASQIFWTLVTFGLLLWLMSKIALPRVGEVLEARQEKIANDLDRAATLKAEAEQVMQAYEKAEAEARANAQRVMAETVAASDAEAAQQHGQLEAALTERTRTAEENIRTAKENAIQSLRNVSAEAAQSAVQHLVGLALPAETVATAVDDVLKERA